MLYTKEIEKITYQDVVDFCTEKHRESVHLDYKREIKGDGLAKTLSAMANTWGGIIVVGVEDDDSEPKLPIRGTLYKKGLREQINNIVLGNITPPIFPEVQICLDDKKKKSLIVIRVPQSNMTPHAVNGNTKVYFRTDTSNEQEELANVDRVLWLTEKRQKSADLKESFYQTAEERLVVLCKRFKKNPKCLDTSFSIAPLYPFDILVDYEKLPNDVLTKMQVSRWGVDQFPLPPNFSDCVFSSVQHGFCRLQQHHHGNLFYDELNQYGFYCHKTGLCSKENSDDKHGVFPLKMLLFRLDLFLRSAIKFYAEIGYWGLLELKVSLNNIENVPFENIPTKANLELKKMGFDTNFFSDGSIDSSISLTETVMYQNLKENHTQSLFDIVKRVGWAAGLRNVNTDDMQYLYSIRKNR